MWKAFCTYKYIFHGEFLIRKEKKMKTNVMLINSPTMGDQRIGSDNYFPMGLLYMGAVLSEENSANVKIFDVNNYFYPSL